MLIDKLIVSNYRGGAAEGGATPSEQASRSGAPEVSTQGASESDSVLFQR